MHFHDLRDTGLTAFMAAGGTLGETMGQGGHTSMKIASRYQKHLKSHMEQVMKEMDRQHSEEIKGTPKEPAPTAPATQALASLLTAMEPTAIAAALATMNEEQKKQILAALPAETVQQVLLATLSK
jgi:flagellar motility protein MotE (MotC chaperone)